MKVLLFLILTTFYIIPIKQDKANNLSTDALKIARANVGVTEDPINSNRGYQVEKYLRSVNLGPGNSWCMAFVYYIYQQASYKNNVKLNLAKSGSCMAVWKWANTNTYKNIYSFNKFVEPGDIMIMQNTNSAWQGHTGIVDSVLKDGVRTIEGNTSSGNRGSQDNGDGVYYKNRKFTGYGFLKIKGFIKFKE